MKNHFSTVENKNLKIPSFADDPKYDETSLGHVIHVVPVKEMRTLTIKWPSLPGVAEYWTGNPLLYLANSLGDEGTNSIMSELVKQDLAVTVMAGPAYRLQDEMSQFFIDITMTEKGLKNWKEMVRVVFA